MSRTVLGWACVVTALAGVVALPSLSASAPTASASAPSAPAAAVSAAPAPSSLASASASAPPVPPVPAGAARTARAEQPIVHREITAGPGGASADVVDVDLTAPGVRVGLLTAGDVAARASVPAMARQAGARAAVNGDFFDLGRSSAPAGPQVRDGDLLSSAVPAGRRPAPGVPGAVPEHVLAVGSDGRARIDRIGLAGTVETAGRTIPVRSLNAFAVPVGGVGVVTPAWGAADRGATLCGSDTDRDVPCSPDRVEVSVRDGRVAAVRPPGAGRLAPDETVLLGREEGARALGSLSPGDPVTVDPRALPDSGETPRTAVGGSPILVGGARPGPLDDRTPAPRTAVGIAEDGRRLMLVTVDGRETAGAGVTLDGLAGLLASLGARDAVNLDGGGSSTMVYRAPGASEPEVVNTPAEDSTRLVPNGLAVFGPDE